MDSSSTSDDECVYVDSVSRDNTQDVDDSVQIIAEIAPTASTSNVQDRSSDSDAPVVLHVKVNDIESKTRKVKVNFGDYVPNNKSGRNALEPNNLPTVSNVLESNNAAPIVSNALESRNIKIESNDALESNNLRSVSNGLESNNAMDSNDAPIKSMDSNNAPIESNNAMETNDVPLKSEKAMESNNATKSNIDSNNDMYVEIIHTNPSVTIATHTTNPSIASNKSSNTMNSNNASMKLDSISVEAIRVPHRAPTRASIEKDRDMKALADELAHWISIDMKSKQVEILDKIEALYLSNTPEPSVPDYNPNNLAGVPGSSGLNRASRTPAPTATEDYYIPVCLPVEDIYPPQLVGVPEPGQSQPAIPITPQEKPEENVKNPEPAQDTGNVDDFVFKRPDIPPHPNKDRDKKQKHSLKKKKLKRLNRSMIIIDHPYTNRESSHVQPSVNIPTPPIIIDPPPTNQNPPIGILKRQRTIDDESTAPPRRKLRVSFVTRDDIIGVSEPTDATPDVVVHTEPRIRISEIGRRRREKEMRHRDAINRFLNSDPIARRKKGMKHKCDKNCTHPPGMDPSRCRRFMVHAMKAHRRDGSPQHRRNFNLGLPPRPTSSLISPRASTSSAQVSSHGSNVVPSQGSNVVQCQSANAVPSQGTDMVPSDINVVQPQSTNAVPSQGTDLVPSDSNVVQPQSDNAVPSQGTDMVPSDSNEQLQTTNVEPSTSSQAEARMDLFGDPIIIPNSSLSTAGKLTLKRTGKGYSVKSGGGLASPTSEVGTDTTRRASASANNQITVSRGKQIAPSGDAYIIPNQERDSDKSNDQPSNQSDSNPTQQNATSSKEQRDDHQSHISSLLQRREEFDEHQKQLQKFRQQGNQLPQQSTSNVPQPTSNSTQHQSTSNVPQQELADLRQELQELKAQVNNLIQQTSSRVAQHTTTNLPQHTTTNVPQHTTTNVPQYTITDLSQYTTTNLPQHTTTNVPQHTTTNVPQYSITDLSQYTTTNLPQHTTTNVPQHTTTNLPQHTTTNVSQDKTTNVQQQPSSSNLPQQSTTNFYQQSTSNLRVKPFGLTPEFKQRVADLLRRRGFQPPTSNLPQLPAPNQPSTSSRNNDSRSLAIPAFDYGNLPPTSGNLGVNLVVPNQAGVVRSVRVSSSGFPVSTLVAPGLPGGTQVAGSTSIGATLQWTSASNPAPPTLDASQRLNQVIERWIKHAPNNLRSQYRDQLIIFLHACNMLDTGLSTSISYTEDRLDYELRKLTDGLKRMMNQFSDPNLRVRYRNRLTLFLQTMDLTGNPTLGQGLTSATLPSTSSSSAPQNPGVLANMQSYFTPAQMQHIRTMNQVVRQRVQRPIPTYDLVALKVPGVAAMKCTNTTPLPCSVIQPTEGVDPNTIKLFLPESWSCHQHFDLRDCNVVHLNESSSEYQDVVQKIAKTVPNRRVKAIHRIENPYLLLMFLLKKAEMVARHGHCSEQLLFHGTHSANMFNIVVDNLDWRKFGSNAGHTYGCGVYFGSSAHIANGYARNTMFLVRVLIYWIQNGTRQTTIPAHESDTTTSSCGSVTVKYDDFTYLPEYMVTFEDLPPRHNT